MEVSGINKHLLTLALIEGAAVMAVELLGAKMCAVYFGNSLYVWTSVLMVTIGGLAIGYFTGGRLTQRFPAKKTLYLIFSVAGLLVMIMPKLANVIMQFTMTTGYHEAAIQSTIFYLMPVMIAFGMIPPHIIHRLSEGVQDSGSYTGYVYTASTLGGVFTCLITGFYLIPSYGVKISTYGVGLILMAVPLFYFFKKNILISVVIGLVSAFTITQGLSTLKQKKDSHVKIIHKSDGLMGQIMIADDMNTEKRSLMINNISQSFMHIPSGRSQWKYVHRVALYASDKPAGSKVLICGIGGGSLITELLALEFNIDAVDIDVRMAEVAVKFFGMPANTITYEDDARHYIRTCKKKYDIIILDMSAGENQPSNVYTFECFKEIQGLMNPDGVLFVHYQNVIEGEGSIAVKSIGKTIAESGLKVKLLNTDKIVDGKKENWTVHAEIMFYASMNTPEFKIKGFDRRNTFADPFNFPREEGIFLENYEFSGGILLTDDNPIMDVLHIGALESTRQAALYSLIPILVKENLEIL